MPNWCNNNLRITGVEKLIAEFAKVVIVQDEDAETSLRIVNYCLLITKQHLSTCKKAQKTCATTCLETTIAKSWASLTNHSTIANKKSKIFKYAQPTVCMCESQSAHAV
jgi:hypothetical protein